jgi:hypothetical protein
VTSYSVVLWHTYFQLKEIEGPLKEDFWDLLLPSCLQPLFLIPNQVIERRFFVPQVIETRTILFQSKPKNLERPLFLFSLEDPYSCGILPHTWEEGRPHREAKKNLDTLILLGVQMIYSSLELCIQIDS